VEFHKSNAIGGRLTLVDDIAPIYKFLCTDGAWINGRFTPFLDVAGVIACPTYDPYMSTIPPHSRTPEKSC